MDEVPACAGINLGMTVEKQILPIFKFCILNSSFCIFSLFPLAVSCQR
jgi:hypothetical protein